VSEALRGAEPQLPKGAHYEQLSNRHDQLAVTVSKKSPRNVRKVPHSKPAIAELAASITANEGYSRAQPINRILIGVNDTSAR
jgi:hypothetical protein